MKRCAGLDVSLETTSICIVDKAGQIIAERKVATCPDAIAQELRAKAPGLVRAGIETGPLAVWLWGELRRRELPILCLDARHANAALKMMPDRTDRADARGLARIVRTGRFRQACVQSLESHAVRALLAARKQPVGMRCRLGNGIRGTLRTTFGIRFGKRTGGFTRRAEAILAEDLAALPAIRFTVGGFSACIDALSLSIVTALAGAGRWVCGARGAAARSRSRTASCAASSATAARAAG